MGVDARRYHPDAWPRLAAGCADGAGASGLAGSAGGVDWAAAAAALVAGGGGKLRRWYVSPRGRFSDESAANAAGSSAGTSTGRDPGARRRYVASHHPHAALGDRPPDRPLSQWRPRSKDGYGWPKGGPRRSASVLRVVPVGLGRRARGDAKLLRASRRAAFAGAARAVLLDVSGAADVVSFSAKLKFAEKAWPAGALAAAAKPPPPPRSVLLEAKFAASPPAAGLDSSLTWEALFLGAVPVVEHSPVAAELLQSIPHVSVERWDNVRPPGLLMKYDSLARRGALRGVARLSKVYWRDAYRRDLGADAAADGVGDSDSTALRQLRAAITRARCHVGGSGSDGCDATVAAPADATAAVPLDEAWERRRRLLSNATVSKMV